MRAVFELAQKYYPKYWNLSRLQTLLKKNKLTQEEYDELLKIGAEDYGTSSSME